MIVIVKTNRGTIIAVGTLDELWVYEKGGHTFFDDHDNELSYVAAWEYLGGSHKFNRVTQKWDFLDENGKVYE